MPQPIQRNIQSDDLSGRFTGTSTVAASPAAGTETIIGSVTIPNFGDITIVSGVRLHGWAAFTAGTNGVLATLAIRQTNVSGAVVASTGTLTVVATKLYAPDVLGIDATPGVGVYVLTLLIGSGSAGSTVSALHLSATII